MGLCLQFSQTYINLKIHIIISSSEEGLQKLAVKMKITKEVALTETKIGNLECNIKNITKMSLSLIYFKKCTNGSAVVSVLVLQTIQSEV